MPINNVVINGTKYSLSDNGNATTVPTGGAAAAAGTWSTISATSKNTLTIQITGMANIVVNVDYTFDPNNVLSVAIPVQPGVTTPVAATPQAGRIVLSATGQLSYTLLDGTTGVAQGGIFNIYGSLKLDNSINKLSVTLAGGGATIVILGDGDDADSSTTSVVATQAKTASNVTVDNFVFQASTVNPGGFDARADISLQGTWDLMNDQLVFVTHYLTNASGAMTPGFYIAVGGKLKGVSGGLEVYMSPNGSPIVTLTVTGQHVWNDGSANWSLLLGYSGKTFSMDMTVKGTAHLPDGTVTFSGNLNIQQTVGGASTIDFSLSAKFELQNGTFTVTASGNNSGYNLQASGTFTGVNSNITFTLKYTKAPGGTTVSLNFGDSSKDGSLKFNLGVVLGPTGLQANFSINVSFVIGQGVIVPVSSPAASSAPAAASTAPAVAALAAPTVKPVGVTGKPIAVGQLTERISVANNQWITRDVPVYSISGPKNYMFKAKMDIDADGAPNAYSSTGDPAALDYLANSTIDSRRHIQGKDGATGPNPDYYVSATRLQSGPSDSAYSFVDAATIPYFVMPEGWKDVQVGDLGIIINASDMTRPDAAISVTHAIFADTNPHVGEASMRAAQNLGMVNYSPKNGGDHTDSYIYIVFPGTFLTPAIAPPRWPDATIKTVALALFAKLGGIDAVRSVFS